MPNSNPSTTTTSSSLLIPIFPNDISIHILAKVPRHHHPTLSLVCKSWHSILHSPLYYTTRSQLSCTQIFLYIILRIHNTFKWFVLDSNPTNPKPLSLVPSIPIQAIGSAFAVVGTKIYALGGSVKDVPSSNVWVYDGRFGNWEAGERMRVGREFAAAGVINGKLYVLGGCLGDNSARSMNWAEVFNPDDMGTDGSWAAVPSPVEVREKWMHGTAVIGKTMYAMADRGGVAFDPEDLSWVCVSTELDLGWRGKAAVVEDVLYCYDYLGKIRGFDVKEAVWRELKGLENDLPKFLRGATMANVGGRLCVVWEGQGAGREIDVSCAKIEVRRDDLGELWGSIVWSQKILTVPARSSIVHCLAVEL